MRHFYSIACNNLKWNALNSIAMNWMALPMKCKVLHMIICIEMHWIELNGVANEMRQWMWSAWIECIWRGHCNIRWHARCLGTSVTFKHILGIWLYGLECSNQAGTVTWQCMIKQAHLRPYPRRSFYHHVCRRIYQQYNLYIPKRLFIFTTYLFICSHRQMCEITPECASGELPPSPRRVCYTGR